MFVIKTSSTKIYLNLIFIFTIYLIYIKSYRVKRGGSRGFVLRDETVDEDFLKESLEAEQKWLGRFRQNQPMLQRKDTSASSRYSFSTEYNSGKYKHILFLTALFLFIIYLKLIISYIKF